MWKLGMACALLAGCAPEGFGSEEQDIVNGAVVTTSTYKTIAVLTYLDRNQQQQFFCTGVLIDPGYVLTQASCFDAYQENVNDAADDLMVYFGVDQVSNANGATVFGVAQAWRQTASDWGQDLAIVKLSKPVSDRAPSPISRTRPTDGTMTTLLGYGAPSNDGNNQDLLRKGIGPTVNCHASDSSITDAAVLCVGASSEGACYEGDMGSPLLDAAGNVLGIYSTSSGNQCNQGVGVFTSVADQLAFIDAHVPVATTTVPPPTTTPPGDTPDPGAPPTAPAPTVGGCSAGGGQGGLFLIALGFIARRARSKRS